MSVAESECRRHFCVRVSRQNREETPIRGFIDGTCHVTKLQLHLRRSVHTEGGLAIGKNVED